MAIPASSSFACRVPTAVRLAAVSEIKQVMVRDGSAAPFPA